MADSLVLGGPSRDETVTPTVGRRAYVFYATNDIYAVAVLVFVRLLRRLGIADGTDVVVLHLPLSDYVLAGMESMEIVARQVPALRFVRDRYCRGCLVKLRIFGLTDYDRVVYVDADAVPLKRLDHLLALPFNEPLAAPVAYWLPQPHWASHLLVVKPSAELWHRVERYFAATSEQKLHDMDIVNVEFGAEIHSLPGEIACLNSEWEDASRPGAFGAPTESYAKASVAHFTALGKPWSYTPTDVRRLRPNAHPVFYRLWEMWWETRDEIFRRSRSSATVRASDPGAGTACGHELTSPRDSEPLVRKQAGSPDTREGPMTLRRAYDFHHWFARTFQHRLGVRYGTFLQTLSLALARNARNIVETGTARLPDNWEFDGQSTRVFGAFAQRYGCKLWTCDVMQSHITAARDLTAPFASHIEYVVSDSVEFLERFHEPIDLLYLDALDFDASAPGASQDHALREGQAALHALHDLSIVLIDDCSLDHGGKGATLVPFLLSQGWQVVRSNYQVLLTRPPQAKCDE